MKMSKIENIVAEFAKTNKISREKAKNFAVAVATAVAANGRKPQASTVEYRKQVEGVLVSGKLGNTFTTVDLVGLIGGDLTTANNTLRYFKDTKQLVKQVGLKDKDAGQKGRRQVLWSV